MLISVFIMFPANRVHAAAGIKITKTTQSMQTVTLNWEQVSGASYYTVVRKSASLKTGNIDHRTKKTWTINNNYFYDTNLEKSDNGKVFCYRISALNKSGKEIAGSTTYIMKTPTVTITDIQGSSDGKVTLQWKKYDYIVSYKLDYVEGDNFNSGKEIRTVYMDKSKSSLTITGLKADTYYTFHIRGTGEGLCETSTVKSAGWYGAKTIKLPRKLIVTLHNNNGSVFRQIKVDKGTDYTLPSMLNPKGYTFIGWGPKKQVLVSESAPYNVPLKAYEKLKNIQGDTHLFAVLSDRSKEKNLTEEQLFAPDISKYKKIIFVGDSRMARTETLMKDTYPDFSRRRIVFVSEPGSGLVWLKDEGYARLLSEINKADAEDSRPIAVIFNSGVNHIAADPAGRARVYVNFYNRIAQELKDKGCRLFVMSANPIISEQVRAWNSASERKEWHLRLFNDIVYKGVQGQYGYIDTYRWLLQTGFGTDSGLRAESGKDDGLHYTHKTYKRIIWKALNYLETH